ncbi:hypothetical protein [Luedemannella helvata]|uniref:Uncharacterized protein n=1 Tax=Luedemannella helvata TaxID=349315 RepID=A0ABP4XFE2_9ACTN
MAGHTPGLVNLTVVGLPRAVEIALREIYTVLDVEHVGDPVAPHRSSRLVSVAVTAHVLIPRPDSEVTP